MKYIILIGDGMADRPIEELGGKTPLEAAETVNMDLVARSGRLGLFRTVPRGFPPGSDVANLSILGYDPQKYYTGRAPLEAASMGVKLAKEDTAFRCNLVTLARRKGALVMDDYSAGHISTEEAREIILTLESALGKEGVRFYPGKSYRHLMVMTDGAHGIGGLNLTPPHDISDKEISAYLPSGGGEGGDKLKDLMERSREILKDHPVNRARRGSGKKTADSMWLWGEGRAPRLPTYRERFAIDGAIISAVDLMNGIGVYAGFEVITVPGVTGYIDTDYNAKADYAIKALEVKDLVCVHVEAPDEASHQGSLEDKLRAIEDFDRLVVGRVLEGVKRFGDMRLLVITDHATPVALKTHTPEPVPFALFTGEDSYGQSTGAGFSEKSARDKGFLQEDCEAFIEEFIGKPLSAA
jgi:2,3-bisphosphoglycerate-independent phosphoglycerate mutase